MKALFLGLTVFLVVFANAQEREYRQAFMEDYGCRVYEYISNTEYRDARLIVLAQAAFESGWGRAGWVKKTNQVFAMLDRDVLIGLKVKPKHWHGYIKFYENFEDALEAQLNYYRRRKYPVNFDDFIHALDKKKYAPPRADYGEVIRDTALDMKKYVRKHCEAN